MPRREALLVYNEDYEDEKLGALRSTRADVERLSEVLSDQQIGRFQVQVVSNEPWHKVQEALGDFFANKQPDDVLLLYLSCHGIKSDDGELYFAARDTKIERLDHTSTSAARVVRQMERSRSRRVIVIIDACYSGAFPSGLTVKSQTSVDLTEFVPDNASGQGRAVLTSSSAFEYAFEGGNTKDLEAKPSVFTGVLIDGLASGEADVDEDGAVSVTDLHVYASRRMAELDVPQRPRLSADSLDSPVAIAWTKRSRVKGKEVAPVRKPAQLLDLIEPFIDRVESAARTPGIIRDGHIASGFVDIDRVLRGFTPGDLVIVYGDSGVGKSVLALDIARSAAVHQKLPTLLATLESTRLDVLEHLFAAEARLPVVNLRAGMLRTEDWTRLAKVMGELSEAPLAVEDRPMEGVVELAEAISMIEGIKLVILDPLALLGDATRDPDLAGIAGALKRLAVSEGLVILCTATSSGSFRGVDPPLGGLDRHADIMIGIHRPDMYERESPRAGEADLVLSKNRRGPTTMSTVAFQGHYSRFIDLAT